MLRYSTCTEGCALCRTMLNDSLPQVLPLLEKKNCVSRIKPSIQQQKQNSNKDIWYLTDKLYSCWLCQWEILGNAGTKACGWLGTRIQLTFNQSFREHRSLFVCGFGGKLSTALCLWAVNTGQYGHPYSLMTETMKMSQLLMLWHKVNTKMEGGKEKNADRYVLKTNNRTWNWSIKAHF